MQTDGQTDTQTDRRTDRQRDKETGRMNDISKQVGAFRDFANGSKNPPARMILECQSTHLAQDEE
jgi:hypothetical protein